MPFGLIDPVVFLLMGPVVAYLVCLGIALAGLFPRLRFRRRMSAEAFQSELKASLHRYASPLVEPAAKRGWLPFPRNPQQAMQRLEPARLGEDWDEATQLEMKKVV